MEIKIENGKFTFDGDKSTLQLIRDYLSSLTDGADEACCQEERGKYVIVRSGDAGVFAGYLHNADGDWVELKNARRLWYWEGAASLSELAMKGVSEPSKCKFPCEVGFVKIIGVCEIIDATDKCRKSIKSVPEWKA